MLDLTLRENEPVDAATAETIADWMRMRMTGRSVARILGHREFYGLTFALAPETLEPRPETELLVDLAIGALPPQGRMLDLGTGSGCIPIAVLANRPDTIAIATDISEAALQVARANARSNGVDERLRLRQGSWFSALPAGEKFDLIVSNPPYIASAVIPTLSPEVRDFDPVLALDGGADGLAPYRVITSQAWRWLKPGGTLLLEIGYDQGAAVTALLAAAGFNDIEIKKDLAGLERVVIAHHS